MSINPQQMSGRCIGVVVKSKNWPDPDENGRCRIFIPGQMGEGVNVDHLDHSLIAKQPDQGGVLSNWGEMEPGTVVAVEKSQGESGSNRCTILGAYEANQNSGSMAGNFSLHSLIKQFGMDWENPDVFCPPNVKAEQVRGALVKTVQEKGQNWKHGLVEGMPTHGATGNMLGSILNPPSSIPTAIQSFSSILTGDMLSKFPGKVMNISSIFNELGSSATKEIFDALPRELSVGLNNMNTLMQTIEDGVNAGFDTAGRVNPDVYLQNALELFKDTSKINNIGDIVKIFMKLQQDPTLFGLDQLANTVIEIEDAFGKSNLIFTATGTISVEEGETAKQAKEALSKIMGSAASFPSGNPAGNLFGSGSQQVSEMINRLPNDAAGTIKGLMGKVEQFKTKTADIANMHNKGGFRHF